MRADASIDAARAAAAHFDFGAPPVDVVSHGQGLINDTFVVTTAHAPPRRFILQRLNRHVFAQPQDILHNLRTLTRYCEAIRHRVPLALQLPALIAARDGADGVIDDTGATWRALSFIERTRTLSALASNEQAHALGQGLGRFHAMVSALPVSSLRVTLPGFHVAPAYLAQLDAIRAVTADVADDVRACLEFVDARRAAFAALEDAKTRGDIALRPTHGDPKLNNFLFAEDDDRVVSLIDLDTVQPGLTHNDIGDCVRSACNVANESPRDIAEVRFDWTLAQHILAGYLEAAGDTLDTAGRNLLFDAIRLLPLELGVRFLTDHLNGDRYFRIQWPGQNLYKARVQFALALDIERREADIRRLAD